MLPNSPDPFADESSLSDKHTIETPEQMSLDFAVAGIGSRFMAVAIDTTIQVIVGIIVFTGVLVVGVTRLFTGSSVWAVAFLMMGGSDGVNRFSGPPLSQSNRAIESLMIGVPSGMGRFACVTGPTLPQAMAGLTTPARPKASAPPDTTTTRFLIIYRSRSVVPPPDRSLRRLPGTALKCH